MLEMADDDTYVVASLAQALRLASCSGSYLKIDKAQVCVTKEKHEAVDLPTLARRVIQITEVKGQKAGTLSKRLEAYRHLLEGLGQLTERSGNSLMSRVLSAVGVKSKGQRELERALATVAETVMILQREVRKTFRERKVTRIVGAFLHKMGQLGEYEHTLIRTLCFRRCLYRIGDTDTSHEILKKLGGHLFGSVLKSMSEIIDFLQNNVPYEDHYTPYDVTMLVNLSAQLEWAAHTDRMLVESVENYDRLKDECIHSREGVESLKAKLAAEQRAIDLLRHATESEDLQMINRLKPEAWESTRESDEEDETRHLLYCFFIDKLQIQADLICKELLTSEDPLVLSELCGELDELEGQINTLKNCLESCHNCPDHVKVFRDLGYSDAELHEAIEYMILELSQRLRQDSAALDEEHSYYSSLAGELERASYELDAVVLRVAEHIHHHAKSRLGVIFPAGTKDHAVLCAVWRHADGMYTFSLIASDSYDDETRRHIRARWSSLTLEDVTDPLFLRELLGFRQQVEMEDKSIEEQVAMLERLYGYIANHFGKAMEAPAVTSEHLLTRRKAPINAEVVISAWLEDILPERLYQKLTRHMIHRSDVLLAELIELGRLPDLAQALMEEIKKR